METILIVDDTAVNINILEECLNDEYNIQVALNGSEALDAIGEHKPDLILLDIMMPIMNGIEVCAKLKMDEATADIPIIFLSALDDIHTKSKGFSLGAADYLTKPFDPEEVKIRVRTQLDLKKARDMMKNENTRLEDLVSMRTESIRKTRDITIRMAASLAETRDNETGNHILRTQKYVDILAAEYARLHKYAFPEQKDINLLVKSAPLHDIGKIGVPDAVLLKPGKLDKDEFTEMKRHTLYGYRSLRKAEEEGGADSFLKTAAEIAYTHHEKWDGSGYPQGLKGTGIPLSGRIMALADVYDALISPRVYKPAFTHSKAISIIEEGKGTHFDPELCALFLEMHVEIRAIAIGLAESEEHILTLKQ